MTMLGILASIGARLCEPTVIFMIVSIAFFILMIIDPSVIGAKWLKEIFDILKPYAANGYAGVCCLVLINSKKGYDYANISKEGLIDFGYDERGKPYFHGEIKINKSK